MNVLSQDQIDRLLQSLGVQHYVDIYPYEQNNKCSCGVINLSCAKYCMECGRCLLSEKDLLILELENLWRELNKRNYFNRECQCIKKAINYIINSR